MTYSFCFALIDQATQQTFGMIPYVGSSVTKYRVGIVTVVQDSGPFDIKRQKVPKPELVGCGRLPCFGRVSI